MEQQNELNKKQGSPGDERMFAMLCHLSALAGFVIPFGNIIGPVIIWAMKKDEYPFVDESGKEAINFQISMSIYILISAFLVLVVIGLPLLILLGLFGLIMIVIGALKANNGELFRYPITIRFLK